MRRYWRLVTGAGLAGFLVLLAAASGARATSINPVFEVSLADTSPSANSDIILDFTMVAPDPNFDIVVTFIPPEFGMVSDEEVTNGAQVGHLTGEASLGLLNGPCNTSVGVEFTLVDASTNTQELGSLYNGYYDYNGNGLPDNVDYYPSFLAAIAPDIQPRERLYGQATIAGVQTFLNFVVFEPGARIARLPELDPDLGYPTVVFLNDPLAVAAPIPVTDFCTPFGTTTTIFGETPEGDALRTNPATPGEYKATGFVRTRWDAEGGRHREPARSMPDNCRPRLGPASKLWVPATPTGTGCRFRAIRMM